MAINFLNTIDFNQNELLNPRIENQPNDAAAGTSVDGQLYFNTANNHLMESDGAGGWKEVGGGVETFTNTSGTFVSFGTDNSSATGAVTIGTIDLSATGSPDSTKYLRGDNTWSAISGIYAWDIAGDTGTETVANGDTVTFAGGTYLTTAYATSTNTLTINHDATSRTDTTSSDSPGYGGTFEAVTSVTTNATGHVTAIDVSTVTIPSAENYTWTLSADSGTNQNIGSGDTVDIEGGTNITTTVGATDKVTIDLDDSISLTGSLTVGTTGSFTGQVTIPTTPVNSTDAASKAYVDSLVSGGLTFKGTFRADSGLILSGANSGSYLYNCPGGAGTRVAVEVGDYYVVATSGGQFYCSGDQLDIGDSIIAVSAAAADSSVVGDWSIVQSDEGVVSLAAATANDLLGINVDQSVGNVKVGLDVDGLTEDTSPATDDTIVIYDTSASTNKKATLANIAAAIDISKGVRILLSTATSGVGRTEAGGLTTFDVNTSTVLSASSALDVKAEITTAAGQTVYADITRSGTTLNVIFAGSVANGTYSALLVDVG